MNNISLHIRNGFFSKNPVSRPVKTEKNLLIITEDFIPEITQIWNFISDEQSYDHQQVESYHVKRVRMLLQPMAGNAQIESYTFKLTQSTSAYQFWTTPPSERVFRTSAVPARTGSPVKVYAAKNEFEPFQIIVKPAASGNVTISMGNFGAGITTELFQVKYVNVSTATDYLGKTGYNPDPLWPISNGASIGVTANQNTAFWINVSVPSTTAAGDYTANVTIGGIAIPVRLHVFQFYASGATTRQITDEF
jgi:hypothetical protein